MGAAQVDLGEVEGVVVVVSDLKAGDGVCQLAGKVEVGRAIVGHEEHAMAGPAAGDGGKRLQFGEAEPALVDQVQADDVRPQVRDEEILPCRIQQGLVRMGSILPVWDGAWRIEGVCLSLDRRERARVRDVEGGYRGPRASGRGTMLAVGPVDSRYSRQVMRGHLHIPCSPQREGVRVRVRREWLDSVTLVACSRGRMQ